MRKGVHIFSLCMLGGDVIFKRFINPRRACAGGLRYLSCLFVCLSVTT